jgi:hypothetical protein
MHPLDKTLQQMQRQEINNDNFALYNKVLPDAVPQHGMYASQLEKYF